MEAFSGWIHKEGGVRHNIKKRWGVVDKDGFTYYGGATDKDLRKPLGFLEAKDILTVCDMGNLKKRDFCIEVITKARTWYFWADNKTLQTQWMEAFEKAKECGKANRKADAGPPGDGTAAPAPKSPRGLGLSNILNKVKRSSNPNDHAGGDEADYIDSDDDDDADGKVVAPAGGAKPKFKEHPYTRPEDVEGVEHHVDGRRTSTNK